MSNARVPCTVGTSYCWNKNLAHNTEPTEDTTNKRIKVLMEVDKIFAGEGEDGTNKDW